MKITLQRNFGVTNFWKLNVKMYLKTFVESPYDRVKHSVPFASITLTYFVIALLLMCITKILCFIKS